MFPRLRYIAIDFVISIFIAIIAVDVVAMAYCVPITECHIDYINDRVHATLLSEGAFIGSLLVGLLMRKRRKSMLICVSALLMIAIFLWHWFLPEPYIKWWLTIPLALVPVGMALSQVRFRNRQLQQFLESMGKRTIEIFLLVTVLLTGLIGAIVAIPDLVDSDESLGAWPRIISILSFAISTMVLMLRERRFSKNH